MDKEGDFLYVLGWFEVLKLVPRNEFHFLKYAAGTFGQT